MVQNKRLAPVHAEREERTVEVNEQSKYKRIPPLTLSVSVHPERDTVSSERGAVEESKGDRLPSTSSGQTEWYKTNALLPFMLSVRNEQSK